MRERLFTILSTASLPFERMSPIPDGVDIQVDPLIEIIRRNDEKLISQITGLSSKKITAVFTSAYAVKFVADQLDKKTLVLSDEQIVSQNHCICNGHDNCRCAQAKYRSSGNYFTGIG